MCEQFLKEIALKTMKVPIDTPPNSLKNSNATSKVKIVEEKEVEIHSLAHSTSKVKGAY
jgi:hypothetical protein